MCIRVTLLCVLTRNSKQKHRNWLPKSGQRQTGKRLYLCSEFLSSIGGQERQELSWKMAQTTLYCQNPDLCFQNNLNWREYPMCGSPLENTKRLMSRAEFPAAAVQGNRDWCPGYMRSLVNTLGFQLKPEGKTLHPRTE